MTDEQPQNWLCEPSLKEHITANLAAFLTVERMITPIENAEDLAKQRGKTRSSVCLYA